jgi:hypothetical protein
MSSSHHQPIKDFSSLKRALDAETAKGDRASFPIQERSNSASTTVETPELTVNALLEHIEPIDAKLVSEPRDQLAHAQLIITDLMERNRGLELDRSRLEQEIRSQTATLDVVSRKLISAHEQIAHHSARDMKLSSISEREAAIAEGIQALASDRELFERELDELDNLKRREADVLEREASLNRLIAELDRREAEVGDLEDVRSDLDKRLSAAEAIQADLKEAEAELRSAKRQLKKKTDQLETMAAEVDTLAKKYQRQQERQRGLRSELADLRGQFATGSLALEKRTKELGLSSSRSERLSLELDHLRALLASIPELRITNPALLKWLAQDGNPHSIGLDTDSWLGWSGVGSYDADAFDGVLNELGVRQYTLPHPSITHIVVGRDGWSKDDLLAQVEMRRGQTLRVYSQEMLLAALITGRDPLDCEEAEVLESFKNGHPALEFLAQSEIEWPNISSADTSTVDALGSESRGVAESPLHALGYTVGEKRLLSVKQRQAFLRMAFEIEDLPWVESDGYMKKWGAAGSHQRLWRIASHLAMLLNGAVGRDRRKPKSRADWIEDLTWLHDNIYQTKRFQFTWPKVEVE